MIVIEPNFLEFLGINIFRKEEIRSLFKSIWVLTSCFVITNGYVPEGRHWRQGAQKGAWIYDSSVWRVGNTIVCKLQPYQPVHVFQVTNSAMKTHTPMLMKMPQAFSFSFGLIFLFPNLCSHVT